MKAKVLFMFFLILGSLSSQEVSGQNHLQYENYLNKNKVPLEELETYFGEKIRVFAKDTIGQKNLFPGTCLPAISSLYSYFLERDIISGYVDIYEKENIPKDEHYLSKQDFMDRLKKSLKMYYLGEVIQENPYKSYLFSSYTHDSGLKIKKEFMVNVKNDILKSIVVLTHYSLSDFGYQQYTTYLGEGRYLHGRKTLYSDVIGVAYADEKPIGFSINPNGFVMID